MQIDQNYFKTLGAKLQESPQNDYFAQLGAKLAAPSEKGGYSSQISAKLGGSTMDKEPK